MNPLAVIALATPLWGFQLAPPAVPSGVLDVVPADYGGAHGTMGDVFTTEEDARAEAHNRTMMDWTRDMSVASTVALAVTGVLGFVQFGDEYGFHGRYVDTACAQGTPALHTCGGETPWVHATAAGTTAVLSTTTLVLSSQVDFDRAARMDGDWRTYETTRWVQFGMLLLQALGGFLLANSVRFGWANEATDFNTLQGFAAAHMVLGAATLGMQLYNTILLF
jgi:hypothetical protein